MPSGIRCVDSFYGCSPRWAISLYNPYIPIGKFALKKVSTLRTYGSTNQYQISLALIAITSIACYAAVDLIGYRVVALVLLLLVSALAMLFDIIPVLITAVLSALIWNFFFIPPTFNFTIGTTEDALMFMMYFVIALINAVLTFKIRQFEQKATEKEGRERTIKLYNTLLSSLSHELKTPISTIIASVDTIIENEGKISEHSKTALYKEINTASLRLNRQVENLLSMSRLDAGVLRPKLDWCDVNEMVYAVIQSNKEDTKNHNVVFAANDQLPLFKIDRGFIENVLHNIVNNALLHTQEDSIVTISVNHVKGNCVFVISDNGPGFPEPEVASVFNKFYRLPHTAAGGTGLGLSIAKGFTEAHNGTIHLENITTGGARFIIAIPAEASSILPDK